MNHYENLERLHGKELETYLDELVKFFGDKLQATKDLIDKHKLTNPEPKYKVGSVVFFRNDLGIRSFRIDEIIDDGEVWYINRNHEGDYLDREGSFDQYSESELFPTRQ